MNKKIHLLDLGTKDYKETWDYQESLFKEIVDIKVRNRRENSLLSTPNFLLYVEHPHVYTLGKSGDMSNLLLSEKQLEAKGATFYKINRGGDITYHGPGQIVGYPILDLENFFTDIHKYLRLLEETIIFITQNNPRTTLEDLIWFKKAGIGDMQIIALEPLAVYYADLLELNDCDLNNYFMDINLDLFKTQVRGLSSQDKRYIFNRLASLPVIYRLLNSVSWILYEIYPTNHTFKMYDIVCENGYDLIYSKTMFETMGKGYPVGGKREIWEGINEANEKKISEFKKQNEKNHV
jgi:hypothetical protein